MSLHRYTVEPAYHLKYQVVDGEGDLLAGFANCEDREQFIHMKEKQK
jgi:hypothetical protein